MSHARTLILGHRGAPEEAPENSLRALEAALAAGADGVELDVRASRDGVPVVIHDETLERTGHGSGRVAEATAAELSASRGGGGETLATLAEVLSWAAAAGAWLDVELKEAGIEREVVRLIEAADMAGRVVLSSFQPSVLRALEDLAPALPRYLLVEHWDRDVPTLVAESGADGVCLRVDAATPLALDVLRGEGLPVIVWTVDEPERIAALLDAGVEAVITNRPGVAASIRDGLPGRA